MQQVIHRGTQAGKHLIDVLPRRLIARLCAAPSPSFLMSGRTVSSRAGVARESGSERGDRAGEHVILAVFLYLRVLLCFSSTSMIRSHTQTPEGREHPPRRPS